MVMEVEIVRDFNGVYYVSQRLGLPEYVSYPVLKKAAKAKGINLPNVTGLRFERFGQKAYAYAEIKTEAGE